MKLCARDPENPAAYKLHDLGAKGRWQDALRDIVS